MTDERTTLMQYRLERAHEALEEAVVLWSMDHYNSSVSKLYYACFYAVSAALLMEKLSSTTHAGTRNLFAQHFVKNERIPRDLGDLYFALFHYRQESDYKDYYRIDRNLAEPWLEKAKAFVATIEQLIQSEQ